jgi:hypothetical protein
MARDLPNTFGGNPVGFYQEIIADDDWKLVPGGIMVAASARDNSLTYLNRGLFLVKLTGTSEAGEYTHFVSGGANGQGDTSTGVVLQYDVDVAGGKQIASAYWRAKIYSMYLRGYPTIAADLAKINQRLSAVPYVRQ